MHVVRDDRAAVGRVRCRRPPSCCCRRRARLPRRTGRSRRPARDGRVGLRPAGPPAAGRRRRGPGSPADERLALERRVPLGAARREELEERGRQHVVHQPERRLLAGQLALQRQEHRERAEERVLGPPRRGRRAQQQVLEGRRPERGEAGRDALAVGVEERPLVRRAAPRPRGARPLAAAGRAPRGRRGAPRRRPARRARPRQRRRSRSIWKKRSCACRKPVARATSRRLAPRTTGTPSASRSTRTGAREPGEHPLAVELRQARAEPRVEIGARARDDERHGGAEPPSTSGQRRRRSPPPSRLVAPGASSISAPSTGWRRPRPPSARPRGRRGSGCGSAGGRGRARRRAGCRSGC